MSYTSAAAIPARLLSCPSLLVDGTEGSRAFKPSEFLPRAERAARALGVTRLANITGLDRLGIPVFSTTFPSAEPGLITVFNGKGCTPEKAKVSALMELVERVSSSSQGRDCIQGSYRELRSQFGSSVLNPELLILHRRPLPVAHVPLNWIWAYDLSRQQTTLVPAVAVLHPYYDETGPLFINNSCGLAAGANLLEATLQALYEVIERDAISLAMASNVFTSVPISTINHPNSRNLIARFDAAGISVSIKEVTTDIGIPVYMACGDDHDAKNSFFLNGGFGAHARRDVALIRALTELAQSRATIISGAREDISDLRIGNGNDYKQIREENWRWFCDAYPSLAYTELPDFEQTNLWTELEWVVGRINHCKLPGPLVVDLSRPNIDVAVVRVIVPGMECWHRDRARIGQRLTQAFRLGQRFASLHGHYTAQ
jgi:putative methanogenesis marker protein 1